MLHFVGSTINDAFELRRRIGKGAYGAVYEAFDLELERRCAVKLLLSTEQPTAAARFLREAKLASRINHPGVVNIITHGHDAHSGVPYIVMEFIDGESLEETLAREGPLPWGRARHFILQICRALEAAHRCRVVHRDLKPGNCMRTVVDNDDDVLKIVDFGIAKAPEELERQKLTAANMPIGTADYMAYEQAMGLSKIDHRVDVWSAGVILYELVSGLLPFRGGTPTFIQRLVAIINQDPVPLAESVPDGWVPDGLFEIVHKALAKDPDARYLSVQSFREALEALPLEVERSARPRPAMTKLGGHVPSAGGQFSQLGHTELDPSNVISVESRSSDSPASTQPVPSASVPSPSVPPPSCSLLSAIALGEGKALASGLHSAKTVDASEDSVPAHSSPATTASEAPPEGGARSPVRSIHVALMVLFGLVVLALVARFSSCGDSDELATDGGQGITKLGERTGGLSGTTDDGTTDDGMTDDGTTTSIGTTSIGTTSIGTTSIGTTSTTVVPTTTADPPPDSEPHSPPLSKKELCKELKRKLERKVSSCRSAKGLSGFGLTLTVRGRRVKEVSAGGLWMQHEAWGCISRLVRSHRFSGRLANGDYQCENLL